MITKQDHKDWFYIQRALAKAKKEGCPPWADPATFPRWVEFLEAMYKEMKPTFDRKNKLTQAIQGACYVPKRLT